MAPLLEEKLVRLDGAALDVETTTSRLEYQGKLALQTIVHDITEHKRAEEIIRLRLKLFEFAADHSLEELMRKALDEIGEITDSPSAFTTLSRPTKKHSRSRLGPRAPCKNFAKRKARACTIA